MLFIKRHSLVSEKPIDIVRSNLKSSNEKINVTELNETKLNGLMKNKYGTGYDIISDINLESISSDKTTVEIKNEFDLFTNLFLIAMFVGLWGISIYKLINGESILSFELILMLTFPIIGALITKSSFRIYDKRIMKIYSSLLNNDKPN
ncbi:hypothetical protein H8K90_08515 [Winogradskyella echinorum]|uniref:Positive regulator of sigma(E), RseC/MucC n=1 Tax=Winogradskyella echinorum TaxID=538189 RepID=A0ABR6Y133_9FLAO|nr:hypothetical protein [Winogradskyella echinorum]MBC3846420.1 hypothetical protein [Winogradskyella echinorum]MBC5750768.1 hypothetical protein [Winogradskyella echinorum]